MIRTSLLTVALLASAGVLSVWAEEANTKQQDKAASKKEGFRVYTILCRSQMRSLHGVYGSAEEAIRVATKLRKKHTAQRIEVTTGSEGEVVPRGNPMLYQVYSKSCKKGGWARSFVVGDRTRAAELAEGYQAKGGETEIVSDHAPKVVYHISGGGCSRSWRLLGAYPTLREAFGAAEQFRTKDKYSCEVTTGTKGQVTRGGAVRFSLYVQGCKGSWSHIETAMDVKKDSSR